MTSCIHRHPDSHLITTMYFVLYKDKQGEWRFTYRAANHEAICVSSEGYTSKQSALHAIALVKTGAAAAKIYDESTKTWS